MSNKITLGTIIKIGRERMDLSQEELASLSKVKYNTLRKIETGKTKDPSFLKMMRIFHALNIDFVEILKIGRRLNLIKQKQ